MRVHWRLLGSLAAIGLLMFQFQNCSQANGGRMTSSDGPQPIIQPAPIPDVRISDDWRDTPIVFASAVVEVAEYLDQNAFYGLCLRQSEVKPLSWTLKEEGQVVHQGTSSCIHGNFELQIGDLQNLSCGISHRLTVMDAGDGASASMTLVRRCPAISSQEESSGCKRERVVTDVGSPACEYVCYDHGIVVQKEALALDLCPAVGL